MSEVGDDWREYREHQKEMKAQYAPQEDKRIKKELKTFEANSYTIKKITQYQYRLNEFLDIFPTSGRFHDIKKQERGFYFITNDGKIEFKKDSAFD